MVIASVGPLVTRARCQLVIAVCQRPRVRPRRRSSGGQSEVVGEFVEVGAGELRAVDVVEAAEGLVGSSDLSGEWVRYRLGGGLKSRFGCPRVHDRRVKRVGDRPASGCSAPLFWRRRDRIRRQGPSAVFDRGGRAAPTLPRRGRPAEQSAHVARRGEVDRRGLESVRRPLGHCGRSRSSRSANSTVRLESVRRPLRHCGGRALGAAARSA
jgi:hypothetical protein